jgi:hypothetical protein
LLIAYFVVFILGTGIALFLLNLPLCSIELIRYALYVASVVCVISIFSKNLREATRLSHWGFWGISAALVFSFDLLIWVYCVSSAEAAGLESFLPFMELVLVGLGVLLFSRLPESRRDSRVSVSARLALCAVTIVAIEHSSVQLRYFFSYRYGNLANASQVLAESPYLPVSGTMRAMLQRSPAHAYQDSKEEKVMKRRVDFEEDLARVLAFFFGLAGFNAIFATTSRHFGLSDAKRMPPLVPVTPEGLASVPETAEPVRRAVFFPNRRYRRGHSAQLFFLATMGNLFVSSITTFSTAKGGLWQFALSFVAYSGMLFPPIALGCRNGFRLAAYRARSSLHGVLVLMHTPGYVPLEVKVRKPTLLQRLQHRITGAWIRHAEDGEGKIYSLMFGNCPRGEFSAQLYRLRSGPLNESLTGRQAYVAIPKAEAMAVSEQKVS